MKAIDWWAICMVWNVLWTAVAYTTGEWATWLAAFPGIPLLFIFGWFAAEERR